MATTTTQPRILVTGEDPDETYPAPSDETFERIGGDWLEASDLDRIVQALIDRHGGRFVHLTDFLIRCCWKRKGGESQQAPVFAKCVKVPTMWRSITQYDYVIWVAADHVRDYGFTRWQLEALMFHELHHASIDEKGKPVIVAHDIEEFTGVIQEYGLWHDQLRRSSRVFEQLPMFEMSGLDRMFGSGA